MPKKPQKGKQNLRRTWLSRLLFLALSAFLWLLLKMSSTDLHADVRIPVQLMDQPEDLMLVNPPSEIQVQVSAPGIYAIRESWRDQETIELSFLDFDRARNGRYFLTRDQFLEAYRSYIPNGVQWRTKLDTIWIETSKLSRKQVALYVPLNLTFEPPYSSYGDPQIKPDSIYVFGPSEYLDTLKRVILPSVTKRGVNEDISERMTLTLPANLHSPIFSIEVLQEVRPFTEKWLEVELRSTDANTRTRAIPGKVKVRCKVAVEDYERLHAGLIRASYKQMDRGDGVVPVIWEHIPSFVQIVEWKPRYVEVVEDRNR